MKKSNDFWLWVILLSFIPIIFLGFVIGSWLENMTLIDRAKVLVPIFLILIFVAIKKK